MSIAIRNSHTRALTAAQFQRLREACLGVAAVAIRQLEKEASLHP
jgi:hypothetical protein